MYLGVLSPLLIGLFLVSGVWHLREGLRTAGPHGEATEATFRRLVDAFFHVLMSAAMLAMLWPGLSGVGGSHLTALQMCVFGGGVMWFLTTTDAVRPRWLDATSMAAMVWMLLVMGHAARADGVSTSAHAGHAGHHVQAVGTPGWFAVVTIGFVGLLALGAAASVRRWRADPSDPRQRGSGRLVGAMMGAGMALSLLSVV